MRIQEIAEKCGYEFYGQDCDVKTISYADIASEQSLAIVYNSKEAVHTKAGAILTEPRYIRTEKTVLLSSDPLEVAAVKITEVLVQNGEIKQYARPVYTNVNGYYVASGVEIGEDTVISPNVFIDEGVKIGKCCVVDPNVQIKGGSIIGDYVHISAGSVIGADACCYYFDTGLKCFPGIGRTVIEDQVEIGCNTIVQRGTFSDTMIGQGSIVGNLVDIGHDVKIGSNCKIISLTGIAGYASIGNWVEIYAQTIIANHVRVDDYAVIMAQSLVTKNVQKKEKVSGRFARKHSEELRKQAKINRLCEVKKWDY